MRSPEYARSRTLTLTPTQRIRRPSATPVLGLVHQIAHLCRGDAGKYCHWGATTQDITDSATILQIKSSFDLIEKDSGG